MTRFSLKALFFLLTALAIGLSVWNQSNQAKRIDLLERSLANVEKDLRIRARINDYLVHVASDLATNRLIESLMPQSPDASLDLEHRLLVDTILSNAKIEDVDGKPGGLEVLSLFTVFHTIPGESCSVNILFNDRLIVDVLTRKTGTRHETHQVELIDVDSDNNLELVLNCTPGFFSDQKPTKLVYFATSSGFKLETDER